MSRTDTEHARWSRAWNGTRRSAKLAGLPYPRGSVVQGGWTGQTTAKGADGSSVCPGDSSHERGDAGRNSHPWDIQQADKPIRVRNAGEVCFRGGSGSAAFDVEAGLPRVSFPFERRAGPPYGVCKDVIRGARMQNMRAPRARSFAQSFRTPRWGEGTENKTASPAPR